jgi:hypothetical protein
MKLCPKCKSTYSDETLKFCLQDGAQLITLADESSLKTSDTNVGKDAPTLQMSQIVTEQLTDEETLERKKPISQYPIYPQPQPKRGGNVILTLGVVVIALCLLALVGIGAIFLAKEFLFSNQNQNTANNNPPNINIGTKNSNNSNKPSNENTNPPSNETEVTVSASSTRAPYKDIVYNASFITDGSLSTAWIEGAGGEGIGEWVRCDFGKVRTLKQIIIYPGYFKSDSVWKKNNRLAAATIYFSDDSSLMFDFDDVMEPQTVDVGKIKTSYVKLVIEDIYAGETDYEDTAISEMKFVFE